MKEVVYKDGINIKGIEMNLISFIV